MTYKQRMAILEKNKMRWLGINPALNDKAGIYILTREENGFKYAYVGQSVHILTRLAEHLKGYQHIDLSLKKHSLYNNSNITGWRVSSLPCEENELDEMEQQFIETYANNGYQMLNKTSGSQGEGKRSLDLNQKERRGYYDGVVAGEKKVINELRVFFDKYLEFSIKGEPNKIKERKLEEFKSWFEFD